MEVEPLLLALLTSVPPAPPTHRVALKKFIFSMPAKGVKLWAILSYIEGPIWEMEELIVIYL